MINQRGSILVETALVMAFVILPGIALQLEVLRASQNVAVMETAVCEFVRMRALGAGHEAAVRRVNERWRSLLPSHEQSLFRDFDHWWVDETGDGWEGVLRIRFQTFFPAMQRHRQMTRRCLFSSSHS